MNSFNHYSLGSVGEWLYRHVAGIELDPDVPGFQRFMLKPYVAFGLEYARATYQTIHGEIESHWRRSGDQLTWTIRVPANTRARVFIPTEQDSPIMESGVPFGRASGLKSVGSEPGYFVCEAGAGSYTFTSTLDLK